MCAGRALLTPDMIAVLVKGEKGLVCWKVKARETSCGGDANPAGLLCAKSGDAMRGEEAELQGRCVSLVREDCTERQKKRRIGEFA